jgi:ribosome-associated heat shock protein Hsp15
MSEERLRLDKWLWAARLYKTRALAADDIGRGRIQVNGQVAKASRELKMGDRIRWRQDAVERTVVVMVLASMRGPAPVARTLYEETAESLEARVRAAESRRLGAEPALSIEQGRPSKRDRRDLSRSLVEWQRWSASADDLPGDGSEIA